MNKDIHTIFENYQDVVSNAQNFAPKQREVKLRAITKFDRENVENSHVAVEGIGVFTLAQIKENVAGKFEDLAKRIRGNEPDFVYKRMYEKYGALKAFVEALIMAEKDIEHMRRAGKLPGLAKRFL